MGLPIGLCIGPVPAFEAIDVQTALHDNLFASLLLVGDIAWLTLLCLCSVVHGCGPLYVLLVWWNYIG